MDDDGEIRRILDATLRNGAQITADMTVGIIHERDAAPLDRFVPSADLVYELLHAIGCRVVTFDIDRLLRTPGVAGSYVGVHEKRIAPEMMAALSKVDVIITGVPGLTKYNIDGHTLANYYGVQFCNIWNAVPRTSPQACDVPMQLLRLIGRKVNDQLLAGCRGAGSGFRITNPWGTDLRVEASPGDLSNVDGGIAEEPGAHRDPHGVPDNMDRIYRGLAGFAGYDRCDGVYVTWYSTALGGRLAQALAVTVHDGRVTDVDGAAADVERLRGMLDPEGTRVHALLMGLNPQYTVYNARGEYNYAQNGAGSGSLEMALGGPGIHYLCGRWTRIGSNHIQLGFIPKISWYVNGQPLVLDGKLAVLEDDEVVALARSLGVAERLASLDWPHRELPQVGGVPV